MDGLQPLKRVLIFGATNCPQLIDPALRRPGRFDRECQLRPLTDVGSCLSMLKKFLRDQLAGDLEEGDDRRSSQLTAHASPSLKGEEEEEEEKEMSFLREMEVLQTTGMGGENGMLDRGRRNRIQEIEEEEEDRGEQGGDEDEDEEGYADERRRRRQEERLFLEEDLVSLAEQLRGMTGAEIQRVVMEAVMLANRRDHPELFDISLLSQLFSSSTTRGSDEKTSPHSSAYATEQKEEDKAKRENNMKRLQDDANLLFSCFLLHSSLPFSSSSFSSNSSSSVTDFSSYPSLFSSLSSYSPRCQDTSLDTSSHSHSSDLSHLRTPPPPPPLYVTSRCPSYLHYAISSFVSSYLIPYQPTPAFSTPSLSPITPQTQNPSTSSPLSTAPPPPPSVLNFVGAERRTSRYVSIDDLEQAVDVVRAAAESKACSLSGGGGGEGIGGGACNVFPSGGLNRGSSASLPGGGMSGLGRRILKFLQGRHLKQKKETCTSSSSDFSSYFSSPTEEREQEVQRSPSSYSPHFQVQLTTSSLSSPPSSASCSSSSSPPLLCSSQSSRRPSCLFSHDQEMTYLSPHAASTRDTSVTSQRGYLASSSFFLSGDEELPCHLDVYPPTSRLIYGRKGMIGLDGRYDGWRREEEKETTFFEKPRGRGVPSFSSSPPPSVSCCCCLSIAEMYVSPLFVRPIASILHLLFSKHEELLFDSLQLLLRRDTLLTSFAFASSSPLKKSSLPSSPYSSSRKIQAFRAPLAFVSPEKKRSHDKEDRDDTRRSLYRDVSVDPGIEDRERKDMKEKSLYISGASLGSGENRSMYKRPTSLGRERHSHHEGDEREAKRKRYSWREHEMEEGDMDREDMNDLERHKKGMDEGFKESSNTSFRSGLVADASTCSSLYEEGGSVSRLTSFSVEPCRPSTQKEEARIIFQQEEEKGERGGEEEEENGDRGEGRRGGEINGEGEEGCGLSVQLNHHPGLRTSCSSFPFSSLPSVSSSSISPPSISFLHSSPSSSLFSFPPACRTPVMPTTPSFLLEGQLAHVYKRVSTVSPRPKWIVLRGGGGGGDRAISGVSSVYGSGGTGGRGRSGEKKEGGEDLEGFPLSVLKRFIVPGLLDALQIESRVDVSPSSLFVGPQSTGPGGTALGDLLQRILSVGSTCIDGRRGAVVLQQISSLWSCLNSLERLAFVDCLSHTSHAGGSLSRPSSSSLSSLSSGGGLSSSFTLFIVILEKEEKLPSDISRLISSSSSLDNGCGLSTSPFSSLSLSFSPFTRPALPSSCSTSFLCLRGAGEHLKNHIGGAGDGEKRREGGKGIGTGRRRDGTGAGGGGGGPSCVHPAACLGEVVLQPPTIEEGGRLLTCQFLEFLQERLRYAFDTLDEEDRRRFRSSARQALALHTPQSSSPRIASSSASSFKSQDMLCNKTSDYFSSILMNVKKDLRTDSSSSRSSLLFPHTSFLFSLSSSSSPPFQALFSPFASSPSPPLYSSSSGVYTPPSLLSSTLSSSSFCSPFFSFFYPSSSPPPPSFGDFTPLLCLSCCCSRVFASLSSFSLPSLRSSLLPYYTSMLTPPVPSSSHNKRNTSKSTNKKKTSSSSSSVALYKSARDGCPYGPKSPSTSQIAFGKKEEERSLETWEARVGQRQLRAWIRLALVEALERIEEEKIKKAKEKKERQRLSRERKRERYERQRREHHSERDGRQGEQERKEKEEEMKRKEQEDEDAGGVEEEEESQRIEEERGEQEGDGVRTPIVKKTAREDNEREEEEEGEKEEEGREADEKEQEEGEKEEEEREETSDESGENRSEEESRLQQQAGTEEEKEVFHNTDKDDKDEEEEEDGEEEEEEEEVLLGVMPRVQQEMIGFEVRDMYTLHNPVDLPNEKEEERIRCLYSPSENTQASMSDGLSDCSLEEEGTSDEASLLKISPQEEEKEEDDRTTKDCCCLNGRRKELGNEKRSLSQGDRRSDDDVCTVLDSDEKEEEEETKEKVKTYAEREMDEEKEEGSLRNRRDGEREEEEEEEKKKKREDLKVSGCSSSFLPGERREDGVLEEQRDEEERMRRGEGEEDEEEEEGRKPERVASSSSLLMSVDSEEEREEQEEEEKGEGDGETVDEEREELQSKGREDPRREEAEEEKEECKKDHQKKKKEMEEKLDRLSEKGDETKGSEEEDEDEEKKKMKKRHKKKKKGEKEPMKLVVSDTEGEEGKKEKKINEEEDEEEEDEEDEDIWECREDLILSGLELLVSELKRRNEEGEYLCVEIFEADVLLLLLVLHRCIAKRYKEKEGAQFHLLHSQRAREKMRHVRHQQCNLSLCEESLSSSSSSSSSLPTTDERATEGTNRNGSSLSLAEVPTPLSSSSPLSCGGSSLSSSYQEKRNLPVNLRGARDEEEEDQPRQPSRQPSDRRQEERDRESDHEEEQEEEELEIEEEVAYVWSVLTSDSLRLIFGNEGGTYWKLHQSRSLFSHFFFRESLYQESSQSFSLSSLSPSLSVSTSGAGRSGLVSRDDKRDILRQVFPSPQSSKGWREGGEREKEGQKDEEEEEEKNDNLKGSSLFYLTGENLAFSRNGIRRRDRFSSQRQGEGRTAEKKPLPLKKRRLDLPWEDLASLVHEASLDFLTRLCDRVAFEKTVQEHEEAEKKMKRKKREEQREEDKVQEKRKNSEEEEEEEEKKKKSLKTDTTQNRKEREEEEEEKQEKNPSSRRGEVGKPSRTSTRRALLSTRSSSSSSMSPSTTPTTTTTTPSASRTTPPPTTATSTADAATTLSGMSSVSSSSSTATTTVATSSSSSRSGKRGGAGSSHAATRTPTTGERRERSTTSTSSPLSSSSSFSSSSSSFTLPSDHGGVSLSSVERSSSSQPNVGVRKSPVSSFPTCSFSLSRNATSSYPLCSPTSSISSQDASVSGSCPFFDSSLKTSSCDSSSSSSPSSTSCFSQRQPRRSSSSSFASCSPPPLTARERSGGPASSSSSFSLSQSCVDKPTFTSPPCRSLRNRTSSSSASSSPSPSSLSPSQEVQEQHATQLGGSSSSSSSSSPRHHRLVPFFPPPPQARLNLSPACSSSSSSSGGTTSTSPMKSPHVENDQQRLASTTSNNRRQEEENEEEPMGPFIDTQQSTQLSRPSSSPSSCSSRCIPSFMIEDLLSLSVPLCRHIFCSRDVRVFLETVEESFQSFSSFVKLYRELFSPATLKNFLLLLDALFCLLHTSHAALSSSTRRTSSSPPPLEHRGIPSCSETSHSSSLLSNKNSSSSSSPIDPSSSCPSPYSSSFSSSSSSSLSSFLSELSSSFSNATFFFSPSSRLSSKRDCSQTSQEFHRRSVESQVLHEEEKKRRSRLSWRSSYIHFAISSFLHHREPLIVLPRLSRELAVAGMTTINRSSRRCSLKSIVLPKDRRTQQSARRKEGKTSSREKEKVSCCYKTSPSFEEEEEERRSKEEEERKEENQEKDMITILKREEEEEEEGKKKKKSGPTFRLLTDSGGTASSPQDSSDLTKDEERENKEREREEGKAEEKKKKTRKENKERQEKHEDDKKKNELGGTKEGHSIKETQEEVETYDAKITSPTSIRAEEGEDEAVLLSSSPLSCSSSSLSRTVPSSDQEGEKKELHLSRRRERERGSSTESRSETELQLDQPEQRGKAESLLPLSSSTLSLKRMKEHYLAQRRREKNRRRLSFCLSSSSSACMLCGAPTDYPSLTSSHPSPSSSSTSSPYIRTSTRRRDTDHPSPMTVYSSLESLARKWVLSKELKLGEEEEEEEEGARWPRGGVKGVEEETSRGGRRRRSGVEEHSSRILQRSEFLSFWIENEEKEEEERVQERRRRRRSEVQRQRPHSHHYCMSMSSPFNTRDQDGEGRGGEGEEEEAPENDGHNTTDTTGGTRRRKRGTIGNLLRESVEVVLADFLGISREH